jgi:F-type H+-transporting ATPase subunit b
MSRRIVLSCLAALCAAPAWAAEGGAGMPQLNFHDYAPQLFWLAVTFIVLYVLMSTVALPQVGAVLNAREQRIAGDLDRAGALKAEAEAALGAYEKGLAEARARAADTVRQTEAAIAKRTAERQAELGAALGGRIKQAEDEIARVKQAAMRNLQTVSGEAARAAVERLIGTAVPAPEAERAVAAIMAQRRAGER